MEELIKSLIEEFGKDFNEENALKTILRFIEFTKDKNIELNKKYWVSEWSWSPICDGIGCYDEIIRGFKNYGTVIAYCTNTNYRTYFPWDIYENKEECELVTSFKNMFGYDWEGAISSFETENKISNELGVWSLNDNDILTEDDIITMIIKEFKQYGCYITKSIIRKPTLAELKKDINFTEEDLKNIKVMKQKISMYVYHRVFKSIMR